MLACSRGWPRSTGADLLSEGRARQQVLITDCELKMFSHGREQVWILGCCTQAAPKEDNREKQQVFKCKELGFRGGQLDGYVGYR